jgi:hypothetical protein
MRLVWRAVPVLLVSLSLTLLLAPRRGQTVPLYAARTGLMCESCHFDPNGGGPRNEFGFAFAKNRHTLAAEDSTSPWKDLTLTNRVGDNMPVYFGVNQRFMLLTNRHTEETSIERLAFFNMENGIHLAFQPHDMLTLVYTLDGFAQGPDNIVRSKEAFGMIGAPSLGGYLKAGRFRVPFGLRLDDHTVATRNGFGDLGTGGTFLPYDPRKVDMGVELGVERGRWFGRAAMTNGTATYVSSDPFANAIAVKLGYNSPYYQGAVSYYEQGATGPYSRSSRWGYYALTHYGPWALIGEVAAGNDVDRTSGGTRSLFAGFGELNYAPRRWANLRVRYDRQELDGGAGEPTREQNTFSRYALEGEFVPVPFAELRWTLRYLVPKDPSQDEERQAYLQFHFSY